ncbi:hypothetical protein [Shewanella algae]|uniref:hypothetical protein n=1 Tax=Shewanella algae TaxID=38313 RepID=UPI000B8ACC52|nr:hypothetical protein [Shewanella algae]MBO2623908.1 hypothetical protein [Shewanella algae]MBO2700060.1 hypothetical protein [Shewanella algae]OXR99873.1 hypothetical protein AMR44_15870 [Shewanella algae]
MQLRNIEKINGFVISLIFTLILVIPPDISYKVFPVYDVLILFLILFNSLYNKNIAYDFWGVVLACFFVLFSVAGILFVDNLSLAALKLYKGMKICIFIFFLSRLRIGFIYSNYIFKFLLFYVGLTFFMVISQKLGYFQTLSKIYSVFVHYDSVSLRPYGFTGNPTHLGFVFLCFMVFFDRINLSKWKHISFLIILFSGNKMSILLGVLIYCFSMISWASGKRYKWIYFKLFFLVSICMVYTFYILFLEKPLQQAGLEWHTISARIFSFQFLLQQAFDSSFYFIFLGSPTRTNWPVNFDVQYVLMLLDLGVVLTLLVLVQIKRAFYVAGYKFYSFGVIFLSGFTIVGVYHSFYYFIMVFLVIMPKEYFDNYKRSYC